MDVSAYLERIGYVGAVEPTIETLDRLIERHLASVPFENIDIARLRRPIELDQQRHFEKIVGERRGGFCYELNSLFGGLLDAIGFGVTRGYGVWPTREGRWTTPFNHIVLAVALPESGESVLVDVGFGADCPVAAIPLRDGQVREIHRGTSAAYRAIAMGEGQNWWRIEAYRPDADWSLIYEVDLTPRRMEEYAERCHYLQTSPESHFTQGLICSRPLPNGRVTLGGDAFILTTDGNRVERPLEGAGDEIALLREWFGIEIDPTRYGEER